MHSSSQPPQYDLLITAIETNNDHGVGVYLQRLFPDSSSFVCLRSRSMYGGHQSFGTAHQELRSAFLPLPEVDRGVRLALEPYSIRRILCVPYYREDFIHAIKAKELTGAPLCTFIMDDQNIFAPHVPDHWVSKLFSVSDLILGISPELCSAYREKFSFEPGLLPPVVTSHRDLVPCYWAPEPCEDVRCAMIGNVWTAVQLDSIRALLRETGLEVDWYGNGPNASWLSGTREDWEADNLRCFGFLPEEDLLAALASYPFVLIPSGTLDEHDDNPAFSHLSLPSRLVFLHARTDTPVLVLGSPDSAAGRFVSKLGTGTCTLPVAANLHEAVSKLIISETRAEFRSNIRRHSGNLVLPEGGEWIWRSLERGRPQEAAFDRVFGRYGRSPFGNLHHLSQPKQSLARITPSIGAEFSWAHAADFAISRRSHLPIVWYPVDPPAAEELELSQFQIAAARHMIRGALPEGGDVLFIGHHFPELLGTLDGRFRLWQLADMDRWIASGCPADPEMWMPRDRTLPYDGDFRPFDAIVSTGWCGQMPDETALREAVCRFLESVTRPGGANIHFFAAVLSKDWWWTNPAHDYLRRRFALDGTGGGLDDILVASDLFSMSEDAYNRHWRQNVGKSYSEFGRPFSRCLIWQAKRTQANTPAGLRCFEGHADHARINERT